MLHLYPNKRLDANLLVTGELTGPSPDHWLQGSLGGYERQGLWLPPRAVFSHLNLDFQAPAQTPQTELPDEDRA